jgi:N-acetylated-alpha-linked acidic dipeptidase
MEIRRAALAAVLVLGAASWTASVRGNNAALLGFTPARAEDERRLEARFDALLSAGELREWMRRLSARPHELGSAYGRENAEFLAAQFRSWGYETFIDEYSVLFPTPTTRVLEMVAPTRFQASLAEPPLTEDPTSAQTAEQLPVYNAYSIDGDVTGELVYVNYGRPEDYEQLDRLGVSVKGRIAIARYGASWRGIKPKVAAEHGAVGCIIYSDPRDDGYFEGDVYPKGAFRNERGAQRGSVADMPLYPGDPLTPGVGATADAKRLAVKEAPTLTKIPVLPISYGDARPLLAALAGPVAPEAWRGALPITYHVGPGPAKVHLKLAFDWKQVPARDVIARLPGAERADEWIIRGNHHDAWVNGASDPISGLVALMAEAKAVGELHRGGWSPKRTVVYAAWDGEEPGLIGSTEWAEAHAELLSRSAAVYINSDTNGRGFLQMAGSHSLEKFLNEVARDVPDPQRGVSVFDRLRSRRIVRDSAEDAKEARERADLRIAALGSGSDYTPFLQHLGVASLNIGFGGEDEGGSYHSIYDSFAHYTRFGDPDFSYGVALAKVGGRTVLRLAEADVLPFEFSNAAETVRRYVDEVAKLADDMRKDTEEQNRRLADKTLEIAADPREPFVPPPRRDPVPYVNLAPLRNAVAALDESAAAYRRAREARDASIPPEAQKELDRALIATERALTRGSGLPGRPWFRHQVYAPGFYTGYGVKTLPAVREALEQRQWSAAEQQAPIVAEAIKAYADAIARAAGVLAGTSNQ